MTKKTCVKTDWETELNEPSNVFEALRWQPPDHGFHQSSYSSDELNDVVDFSNLSDQFDDSVHKITNPFILNEAEESRDNSNSSSDSATLANEGKNC